jgi:hypothetical protein
VNRKRYHLYQFFTIKYFFIFRFEHPLTNKITIWCTTLVSVFPNYVLLWNIKITKWTGKTRRNTICGYVYSLWINPSLLRWNIPYPRQSTKYLFNCYRKNVKTRNNTSRNFVRLWGLFRLKEVIVALGRDPSLRLPPVGHCQVKIKCFQRMWSTDQWSVISSNCFLVDESTELESKTPEKKPLTTTVRPGIWTPNLPNLNLARISRGHGGLCHLPINSN